ncbi:MAG: PBECR4 domain-containing protein [Longibaculum sp.]
MHEQSYISVITEAAKMYQKNLLDKNVMFIHFDKRKNIYNCTEMLFGKQNFMHLTGLDFVNSNEDNLKIEKRNAVLFYNKCINNKVSLRDIKENRNGWTPLKIDVIRILMNIHKNAKMIGKYNFSKPLLVSEKICGGVNAAMGISKDKNGIFFPQSGLKEDIRKLVNRNEIEIIKVIMVKEREDRYYSDVTYGDLNSIYDKLSNEIKEKIKKN